MGEEKEMRKEDEEERGGGGRGKKRNRNMIKRQRRRVGGAPCTENDKAHRGAVLQPQKKSTVPVRTSGKKVGFARSCLAGLWARFGTATASVTPALGPPTRATATAAVV
eukprot:216776-Pyramimonas_sp.AAC.1